MTLVRRYFGPIAFCAMLALTGCGDGETDETPSPSPEEEESPPPGTPWPLTLQDGPFVLWNAYVFPADLGYLLVPEGNVEIEGEALKGELTWAIWESYEVYLSSFDDESITPLCEYVEAVDGAPDTTVSASSSCEGCQTYYQIMLSPEDTGGCDGVAIAALLDTDGNGTVSNSESVHEDVWAFSVVSDGTWPSAWTSSVSWSNNEGYLLSNDARYAAWSHQWHDASGAYLPLYALLPATTVE